MSVNRVEASLPSPVIEIIWPPPCSKRFRRVRITGLRGLQYELDLDCLERELDTAVRGAVEYAGT